MKNDFLYMKTMFLRLDLFVILKYSHFATNSCKVKIGLVHYFPYKSTLYGADVSVSFFIFAQLQVIITERDYLYPSANALSPLIN